MIKKVLFVITLLLLAISAINSQESKEEERKKKEAALMKDIMEEHGPIHLIGKVVDQNGDGVQGAEVIYFYNWFCLGHEYFYCDKWETVKTDEKGIFEIKVDKKVRTLNINKILKDGYDSGFDGKGFKGERNFSKYSPFVNPKAEASENIPIFQIRKKGEPTIVITSEGEYNLKWTQEEENRYAICFICDYSRENLEKIISAGKRIDLIVTGKYETGEYRIKFKAEGEKGAGVLLREDKLYEAPSEGYQSEVEILINPKTDLTKRTLYLYARTGNLLIFSRLRLNIYLSSDLKSLTIRYYSYTNPYGERSFEEGQYMFSSDKYETLKIESWKSLRQGYYPKKPDFRALEEEGKKEYLKKQKETQ